MSVKEFFHAIAVSDNLRSTTTEFFNLANVVIPHSKLDGVSLTLSNSCGGFLEVQAPRLEGNVYDPELFLIQLIHRSVRTFLEKEEAGPFRVVQRECNLEITDTCIRYLKFSLPCPGNVQGSDAFVQHLGQHSLLAYIWTEFPIHLHHLDEDVLAEKLQELTSLLRELRRIDGRHPGFLLMHTWTLRLLERLPRDHNVFGRWKAQTRSELTEPSNIPSGLQNFLCDIVVAATKANQFLALKSIFDAGALLCDEDDYILSAGLETATKMNNLAILKLIGEHRTVIDPTDSSLLRETFSKALKTACTQGYKAVSEWLVDRGAIAATEDQGCTAIYLAVNSGHETVVKMLLEHGINPHYQRQKSRSLLWVAAEKGYVSVIRDLLHFGADPYSADDQGRTPLVMALEAKNDAIVRALLPLTGENPVITNSRPTLPFLVPCKRNPGFVGMLDVLNWLEDALKSQRNHIVLYGLVDQGKCSCRLQLAKTLTRHDRKTQTVLEFAYDVFERHIVSSVFWIDAHTDDTFLRDHEYICQRIGWALRPNDPPKAKLAEFYHRLQGGKGTKLVIWDNLEALSDLIGFTGSLPSTKSISLVITSRNPQISQELGQGSCMKIPPMSNSESLALLKATSGVYEDSDTLLEIVDLLGGLPLAISVFGGHMSSTQTSPPEYLSMIKDKKASRLGGIKGPIYENLEFLENADAQPFETLAFMSILGASRIPKYLLLHQSTHIGQISKKDLEGFIASLSTHSLFQLTEDQDQSHLTLEPVIRSEVRRRIYRKGKIAVWENKVLKAVSYEFPEMEVNASFRAPEKCGELLPHVLAVLKCDVIKDEENTLHRYRLLRDAGAYSMTIEDWKVAEDLLQEAYLVSMKHFGSKSEESQSLLAMLVQLQTQVLEMRTRMSGIEHPDTLASMVHLTRLLSSQDKFEEAERLHRQTLSLREKVLDKEYPDTLADVAHLARLLSNLDKHMEAERLHRQMLSSSGKVLGKEHPETLRSMSNLVEVLKSQGRD